MLDVAHLQAAYGPAQVLFDIGFRIGAGEVVTLLGRNGMGKTTTINTIMGMLPASGGSAMFEGRPLLGLPSYRVAQAGLGLVPEGRQVFPTLSVEENLVATARADEPGSGRVPGARTIRWPRWPLASLASAATARIGMPRWTLEQVYAFFPQLAERRRNMGNQLSGGEQQMLAIGRALMTNPKLLILDEATEGLAPLIRTEIWNALARLKGEGQAILVVDKHLGQLMKLADRHVIIEKGEAVWSGTSAELNQSVVQRYLQV